MALAGKGPEGESQLFTVPFPYRILWQASHGFPNGLQPVFHIPFCRCHGLIIHDFRELSIKRNKLNSLKCVDVLTKIVKKAL